MAHGLLEGIRVLGVIVSDHFRVHLKAQKMAFLFD
jgi:hypothetical protein